jgi:hypothetical protein
MRSLLGAMRSFNLNHCYGGDEETSFSVGYEWNLNQDLPLVVEGEIVLQDTAYDMDISDGDDDRNFNEENEEIKVSAPTVGMKFDSIEEAL